MPWRKSKKTCERAVWLRYDRGRADLSGPSAETGRRLYRYNTDKRKTGIKRREGIEKWDYLMLLKKNYARSADGRRMCAVKNVNDPTFSEEILGKGIAIVPAEGKVYAPADG